MGKIFKARLKVRSYEVDFYGHVNNAVYLNYLEYARMEYMAQTGRSFESYLEKGMCLVVVRAVLNFKGPALMGHELEISGFVRHYGRSSVIMEQRIWNRSTEQEILDAEVTLVFVDKNRRPVPVPEEFKRDFPPVEEDRESGQ